MCSSVSILYHGWNDAAISALNTINYYQSVAKNMGKKKTDSFMRLYMVPGMQHCRRGPGPNVFGQQGLSPVNDPQHNIYLALEQWVERGTPPSTIVDLKLEDGAPAGNIKMTRPLCVYPEEAKYTGSGDTNSAASFVCQKAQCRLVSK
jgi:feruloyl esterase